MLKPLLLFIAIIFFNSLSVSGQKGDSLRTSSIHIIAKVSSKSITLRWAPSTPNLWLLGNKHGYVVERYTFLKNGKLTDIHTRVQLNSMPLKPWPVEKWESLADTNDYAAVAAQAIYGSSFEVDLNKAEDLYSIFNKVKENESRYTFTLHSANHSSIVASASALSFEDSTISANEAYLYRIYIPIPENISGADTGKIFVDAAKITKWPKIKQVTASVSGNSVLISWDTKYYERDYVSYLIERSDDGGNIYKPLSKNSFVNLGDESTNTERVVYLDSVPVNNQTYYYRVKGKTSFTETGPASDSIRVIAHRILHVAPKITSANIINGKINIKWDLPLESNDAIKGFQVERAINPQSDYQKLNELLLFPEKRDFTDNSPQPSNYYQIVVWDKEGNSHTSLPYFVQLEDSIPPMPPVIISGEIDTTGTVLIKWANNTETDLLGYRVFRSYFLNSEFVQVTVDPINQNQFIDKVSLKNLNKHLYYKIKASDTHHNNSEFSNTQSIKQADIIPPSPPAYSYIKVTQSGVNISLIPSSSDDVEKYLVYRKESLDSLWTLLTILTGDTLVFTDSTTLFNKIYTYNVIAVDSSMNESTAAKSIKCKAIFNIQKNTPVLRVVKSIANKTIELKWYAEQGAKSVTIYKACNSEPFSLYTSRAAEEQYMLDENVKLGHTYRYMIKAILKDGTESQFSKVETIENF